MQRLGADSLNLDALDPDALNLDAIDPSTIKTDSDADSAAIIDVNHTEQNQ